MIFPTKDYPLPFVKVAPRGIYFRMRRIASYCMRLSRHTSFEFEKYIIIECLICMPFWIFVLSNSEPELGSHFPFICWQGLGLVGTGWGCIGWVGLSIPKISTKRMRKIIRSMRTNRSYDNGKTIAKIRSRGHTMFNYIRAQMPCIHIISR